MELQWEDMLTMSSTIFVSFNNAPGMAGGVGNIVITRKASDSEEIIQEDITEQAVLKHFMLEKVTAAELPGEMICFSGRNPYVENALVEIFIYSKFFVIDCYDAEVNQTLEKDPRNFDHFVDVMEIMSHVNVERKAMANLNRE